MDDKLEPDPGSEERSSFFAHSVSGQATDAWQPLSEHLPNVSTQAACKAAWFGAQALAELAGLLPDWEHEITLQGKASVGLPKDFRLKSGRERFQFALLTRMIFSCLVDADCIDANNFYRRIQSMPLRPEGTGPSLGALRDRPNAHVTNQPEIMSTRQAWSAFVMNKGVLDKRKKEKMSRILHSWKTDKNTIVDDWFIYFRIAEVELKIDFNIFKMNRHNDGLCSQPEKST
jgi:hypothetical protein